MPSQPDHIGSNDLDFLFSRSVAVILKSEDSTQFLRWFDQYAEDVAPIFFRQFQASPDGLRSFKSFLSRFIWNRTALPGNHFRPRPLPKPERNTLCPCGSGNKYKHCCLAMEPSQDNFPNISMLPFVLDTLTAKQLAALPFEYLSAEELEHVARQWMLQARIQDAVKLLEGLFADFNKLGEQAEPAFDCLLDCYDILGNPLKKKRLLERGSEAKNKYIRAAAMQRRCCILADRNEYAEAWVLFQELQRLIPNDPSLSHLEITLLVNQGEKQRAAERARFWVARLSRDIEFAQGPLIEYLRTVAQGDIHGAMTGIAKNLSPDLSRLVSMLEQMPEPVCHYTLNPMSDSAGPLTPDKKLLGLFAQWEAQGEYSEVLADDIEWLEHNPLSWQCFEILDDWLATLEDARISHGFEEVVLLPALRHAEALLRLTLKHYQAEELKLEWAWHENRPALRLLERLIGMLRLTKNFPEAVRVAEWLVLTLNPNDNQGLRSNLIHDYLRLGRITDALTLSKNYPDDMADMSYGTALALFMDHQDQAAQLALVAARTRYPEVAKILLADKPKQPRLRDGMVQIGGKDEAWYYFKDNSDIWQQSGGLEWLRQSRAKK
ncbi:MAG: SEC-C domain-containing protein [Gallionella sp.]|nr:SEC-C domain-containing protein [Gallionella sp.]